MAATSSACPDCAWVVPSWMPDYLVPVALADHRRHDCGQQEPVPDRAVRDA